MSDERKKTAAAFWLTVALVVALAIAVAYPLSIGPAVWLHRKMEGLPWMSAACNAIYTPLELALEYCPDEIEDRLEEYANWWVALADP